MKVTQLIALTALAFAGTAALADDPTVVVDHFTPTLTRAEVQAEVMNAHRQGELNFVTEIGGQVNHAQATEPSNLTRAEVRRDAIRAERHAPVIYSLA